MLINQEIITIFCNCSYSGIITQDTKEKIFEKVQKFDTKLLAISDLCFASVKKEKLQILNNYKKINIIACYPRAVKWILHNAGVDIDNKEIKYFNMRAQRVEDFNDFTQEFMTEKLCHKQPIFQKNLQWVPWFPVIDYNRCINCRQCVSFCLFGVYHIDEKNRAYVKNPANCKTNCPACGRICPEAAIIFPKVDESPINGDEIKNEEMVRANIKNNVDKMLGDDIYVALAKRKKKAKMLRLRKQAESEREKYSNHK